MPRADMPIITPTAIKATHMADQAEPPAPERSATTAHPSLPAADRRRPSSAPISVPEPVQSPVLPLMFWLSPAFPVGSFAYSHALEWAFGAGHIRDLATASAWITDLIHHGGLRNDAILLAAAWRAASKTDRVALAATNELALALAGSRERHLETSAQGNAFAQAITTAWSSDTIEGLIAEFPGDLAYPVAVGLVAAAHAIHLEVALEAFCGATVSNLVSSIVRLGAIGQSDGQRLIAAVLPDVVALAALGANATIDDLGGAAFQSDIATLRHETQYTRLFRS